jgi:NACHT N-terminal Helical domain 7/AAA domain
MRSFKYADAAKLLGGNQNAVLSRLDNILGGTLLGGAVLGVSELLGWFDAKVDFIRMSKELVGAVSDVRKSRADRTERLHAAHSVIVLVAFFEAFDELGIPFTTKSVDLTRQRQLNLHQDSPQGILDAEIPLLSPDLSYEKFLQNTLRGYYDGLALTLMQLITGLAFWDNLTDTERDRHSTTVKDDLAGKAIRRYEDLLRTLSTDCPEVGLWTKSLDSRATREEIRSVGLALSRLEKLLVPLQLGDTPTAQRTELSRLYRSALTHPVLKSSDAPGGLTIPRLEDCYIDPYFQVTDASPSTDIARKSWWDGQPVWPDIDRFMAGYLTSPKSLTAPMLVLGDPGSGKSVFTKMLAARLPASDFVVVRVALRSTPSEADILQQIEHGLKEALKEDVSWPSLVRSAGQALPVVLLDGFDELLQATGVHQTDYLGKIARFQRDRADIGHPVAFVVTSRISVADRAKTPPGTVVVRLTPFAPEQSEQWLTVWQRTNARYFEATGLRALDLNTAKRYPELAEQPLLLFMLALYDADNNALQRTSDQIDQADLYERLLRKFADREVSKEGDHLTEPELAQAVEDELERLAIVAFAMFNRGAQWVTEAHVSEDLAALVGTESQQTGMRSPISPGAKALGRFFFVQRAETLRDNQILRTYEFLHATFGEYLIARHIWNILTDLPNRTARRSSTVDDGELYALLSFVPLSSRWSIVGFLQEMVVDERRSSLAALTTQLFRSADQAHVRHNVHGYIPFQRSAHERYAVYSANLVILSVILAEVLHVSDLSDDVNAVQVWQEHVHLWKALLSGKDIYSFASKFHLTRAWEGDQREIELRLDHEDLPGVPPLDVLWSVDTPADPDGTVFYHPSVAHAAREIHFYCDMDSDVMLHAMEPLESGIHHSDNFAVGESGRWMTGTHALLGLIRSDRSMNYEQRDYLRVLGLLEDDDKPSEEVSRVVFAAIRGRPHDFIPQMLAAEEWIARDPRFWSHLCDLLGKGGNDTDLLAMLIASWDQNTAYALIPEDVVDAWLRMAERGIETTPSLADVVTSDLLDLDALARARPDLIRRAHNMLQELGDTEALRLPGA